MRKIFLNDFDRDNFLKRLGNVLSETATPCFACALIPNHAHLLLGTGTTAIATVMRRLLTRYAVSFNRRHRRHGQPYKADFQYSETIAGLFHARSQSSGKTESVRMEDTEPIFKKRLRQIRRRRTRIGLKSRSRH
jgi:hypothetical protein